MVIPPRTELSIWLSYIDTDKKRVRSITGEIETDLNRGLYQVNTPRAQGVAGMLGKAGVQKL